jgi:hypothetical protein
MNKSTLKYKPINNELQLETSKYISNINTTISRTTQSTILTAIVSTQTTTEIYRKIVTC